MEDSMDTPTAKNRRNERLSIAAALMQILRRFQRHKKQRSSCAYIKGKASSDDNSCKDSKSTNSEGELVRSVMLNPKNIHPRCSIS